MCSPEHFTVEYAINPWMDVTTPVDADLAVKQWDRLRETLVGLGHEVHLLTPEAGLPDMVYAANGAFVVDGSVYGARFKHEQRSAEAAAHRAFYEQQGWRFIALASIDDENVVYYPGAFSAASQKVLAQLFPDAIVADDEDALAFGLNLVSDGLNVVLNNEATRLAGKLKAAGYHPVPVELAELKKGGGSVKCCIAELRH